MENKELKDRIKFKIAMSEIDNERRNNMKKIKFIKNIAAAACFVFFIGGVTFADAISEKIYDIYNFRKKYDLETKLPEEIVKDEEKLQKVLKDYNSIMPWDENAAEVIESQDTTFKITEVGMDDYFMIFRGKVNFGNDVLEKMSISDIYKVRFPDLVIKDENDNVLFCMEENTLKNIFQTEDIDSIKNNPKYCVSEVIISSFKNYEELGNNPYEFDYCINTIMPSNYPKSKKLYFEFTKIALDGREACMGKRHYLNQDQTLTILGNWKIEYDLSPKFYEREDLITYKVTKTDSNPNNKLLYCYYKDGVMHTEFRIESEERNNGPWGSVKIGDMLNELNIDRQIRDYIMYDICSSDEFKAREAWVEEARFTDYHYIENSNGVQSKPHGLCEVINDEIKLISKTSSRIGGVISDGVFKSSTIPGFDNGKWSSPSGIKFDISEADLTDKMKVKIGYLGKDIVFEIERVKKGEK